MNKPIQHQMDKDLIKWGNPSQEDRHNMGVTTYLDDLFPELSKQPPYANSSVAVQQELNQLVVYSDLQASSERKQVFDSDLVPYMQHLFISNGVDPAEVTETTTNLVTDILPLITRLKFHYQRPRPYQLAYYYGLKLFPCYSKFVSSPSYPSGHTVMCAVMAEVLATHYAAALPGCYGIMQNFAGEVMESRLYMGVHYASDNRFALKVSDAIINLAAFRRKYEF